MIQWWSDRKPREQALLLSAAGFVVAFIFVQFLIIPLVHYRSSARDQLSSALEMLTEVEKGARAVQAIRATAGEQPAGAVRTVAASTATELGISITRLQPLENDELDVWLDDVAAPLLFSWIGRLAKRGVPVARAVIHKGDGTSVNAQITLTGAPGP